MQAKYNILITAKAGLNVWDRPAAQSEGAIKRYAQPCGSTRDAYQIINQDGVPYAQLVPQNPIKPEYMRLNERDMSQVYAIATPLNSGIDSDLAEAIRYLADAILAAIGK
jgi:hypothetical protein